MGFVLVVYIVGAALAAFGGVFAAVCRCAAKKWDARTSDCLIVLGAKVRPDGGMSNSLRYRCEAALSAWERGAAENVIVCGGRGSGEPVAEAAAMEEWLIARGVPRERIRRDETSSDTRENLVNAGRIMARHSWRSAAVVTSDYHVQRALWLARDTGMDACGIAAKSPSSAKGFIMARARESCSWILYGFRRIF